MSDWFVVKHKIKHNSMKIMVYAMSERRIAELLRFGFFVRVSRKTSPRSTVAKILIRICSRKSTTLSGSVFVLLVRILKNDIEFVESSCSAVVMIESSWSSG